MFGDMLLNFCNANNVDLVDKSILSADTYTYGSSAWGTTSWLDHVVCTSDAKDCTTHVEVMYDCIFSDHHPVLVKADLNILAEVEHEHSNDLKQRIPVILKKCDHRCPLHICYVYMQNKTKSFHYGSSECKTILT